jgi:hypothetical protein
MGARDEYFRQIIQFESSCNLLDFHTLPCVYFQFLLSSIKIQPHFLFLRAIILQSLNSKKLIFEKSMLVTFFTVEL